MDSLASNDCLDPKPKMIKSLIKKMHRADFPRRNFFNGIGQKEK